MIKKNTGTEILPRLLWGVMAICLFLGQYLTDRPPTLTDNTPLVVMGIVLSAGGFLFWMYVARYMRVEGALSIKDKELVTGGPFEYVRHPMYLGIYVMMIGIGLLFFFSWIWFAIMIAFIPVWYVDCRIEEKLVIELHKEKYLDYKKRTGMFFPKVWKG